MKMRPVSECRREEEGHEEREISKKLVTKDEKRNAEKDEGVEEVKSRQVPNEPSSSSSSGHVAPSNPRTRDGVFIYGEEDDVSVVMKGISKWVCEIGSEVQHQLEECEAK